MVHLLLPYFPAFVRPARRLHNFGPTHAQSLYPNIISFAAIISPQYDYTHRLLPFRVGSYLVSVGFAVRSLKEYYNLVKSLNQWSYKASVPATYG
jgi:hypothetical protein